MMLGVPGSQEEFEARIAQREVTPPSRGPKPVMGWTGGDEGAADTGSTPADTDLPKFIGKVEPGHKRYYLGQDHAGPVLKFMPPAEPLPEQYRVPTGDGTERT